MSLSDYEDFVYRAGKLNEDDRIAAWQAVHPLTLSAAYRLSGLDEQKQELA